MNHEITSVFVPFKFDSRAVRVAGGDFDFSRWRSDPSEPVILRGAFTDWPLFQHLRDCNDDQRRLDYLASEFGEENVSYTAVPAADPFMGYDAQGRQNFRYAPSTCSLRKFCSMLRDSLERPSADVLYARGGANSVRAWRRFSSAIRPFKFLAGMTPNGEGVWLGSGRHISYLHQDAHFNLFVMLSGAKRVLMYPLEAIGELYPTPFYDGIAGTTSSFVRPPSVDPQRFPRFENAAKHSWVAVLEEGDLLCIPPCWWHYVEAGPGLSLMINTFLWALPPRQVRRFELLILRSIRTSMALQQVELLKVRNALYGSPASDAPGMSLEAAALADELAGFLRSDIPHYWRRIARCYIDHYIFQTNGHPVSAFPELHMQWVKRQSSIYNRVRQWARFNRDLMMMSWRRKTVSGVVP